MRLDVCCHWRACRLWHWRRLRRQIAQDRRDVIHARAALAEYERTGGRDLGELLAEIEADLAARRA